MADRSRKSTEASSTLDDAIQLPKKEMYTSWPDIIRHWPKSTFLIVANEFCERFSYYGMRTVLILYVINVLKFSDNASTIFFNSFTVVCYATPMLGSIIADGYIGKFWTIFSVSIIYAAGQVILALASTKNFESSVHPWMDYAGLIIIAFGTGGIKPCVSAFGADQFEQHQERMISLFFSVFYFSINAGSMISSFITPIFRSRPCLGQDSCYPLAFGIPAVLMVVATGFFMLGSFWYKRPPPTENIFGEVSSVMFRAIRNKAKAPKGTTRSHWLEYYLATHSCDEDPKCQALQKKKSGACQKKQFIEDIRSLFRVLVMFLPVPMFWALYDQQGSVWLIQGIQMDSRLWGNTLLLPDQMQTINAVLILAFIPLFQVVVYPIVGIFFKVTPLRKMVSGGLLAALAFLITGFIQIYVNKTLPQLPGGGQAYVGVWNQIDGGCMINVTSPDASGTSFNVNSNQALIDNKKTGEKTFHFKFGGKNTDATITFNLQYINCANSGNLPLSYSMYVKETKIYYMAVSSQGIYHSEADPDKPQMGTGEFSIGLVTATNQPYAGNLAMCRWGIKTYTSDHPCNPKSPSDFYYWETDYNRHTDDRDGYVSIMNKGGAVNNATIYAYKPVKPGSWGVYLLNNTPKDVTHKTYDQKNTSATYLGINITIHDQGGVYALSMTGDLTKPEKRFYQIVQSNTVPIMWQFPQYVIITAAEILFSITGLEFAYSQSAPSMKALVQALWLFTSACGDSIIVIIAIINPFSNMATMFFAYAGLMTAVMIIFALISVFYYEYRYYTTDEDSESSPLAIDEDGKSETFAINKASLENKGFRYDEVEEEAEESSEDERM